MLVGRLCAASDDPICATGPSAERCGGETLRSPRRALVRLMEEGLDRHEAIHAIAMALSEHIWDLLQGVGPKPDSNAPYFAALDHLTAEEWRRSG